MSLREMVKTAQAKRTQRGILIPYINEYLLTRDTVTTRRYMQWVQDFEKAARHKDHRFHPSQIDEHFCARAWCLDQYAPPEFAPEPRVTDAKGHRIFAMGDATHAMVQHWFAEMGRLYGLWKCAMCGKTAWGISLTTCQALVYDDQRPCLGPMAYKEIPIDHEATGVLGHLDGEVILGDDVRPQQRFIMEIKSTNSRVYESVAQGPLEKHRHQAMWYLYLRSKKSGRMKHLGEPVRTLPLSGAVVLYVNKDTQEMREHLITLTDDTIDEYIKPALVQMGHARAFTMSMDALPDRICASALDGEMRRCVCVKPCFALPPEPEKKTA